MFDTKKIDTFFNGDKNLLEEEEKIFITRRTKVVRFFKLFMPCLTALLLGLGVILFDFETNNDTSVSLADDEKIYFEKFRMKNTVFEITEKDNRFNTLKATEVEEKEAGSKIYDLLSPDLQTLDKGKVITLMAQKGIYNQNTQILDLISDVTGNYDGQMKIKTESTTYNFSTETGFGNQEITGTGDKASFKADRFTFNKKEGSITLIGNVFMKSDDKELQSPHQVTLYTNENKLIAQQAAIHKAENILKGDTVTAFFKDMKHFEITTAYSEGHTEIYATNKTVFAQRGEYSAENKLVKLFDNVKIVDASGYTATGDEGIYNIDTSTFTLVNNVTVKDRSGYNATAHKGIYDMNKKTFTLLEDVQITKNNSTISAPRAIYFQTKDEFHLYDNVKVAQEDSVATAKSGVYFIKKNVAELNDNVIITKNGNQVHGDKAISDFTTSKSRLIPKKGGRIFGKLIENTLKKDAKDK